jgi:prepilin-type processing-associated H-X9-DG protein/prepilin-type N-terminal cleavage/methylation domain-containing protein
MRSQSAGFTLVELLVVILIIALLVAMLMPALARAQAMARSASCMNNLRSVGLSLHIYQVGSGGYFPSAYNYINGDTSGGGYWHWSMITTPDDYKDTPARNPARYPAFAPEWVCPSHSVGGFAPTNFTTWRIPSPPPGQVTQTAGLDDRQVPRLSYVVNEAIMPRKKFSAAHDNNPLSTATNRNLRLVRSEEIDNPVSTILVAEFSDSPNCIYGSSIGGGDAYKSHRPTNAIKTEPYAVTGGTSDIFDGELYDSKIIGKRLYKLTVAEAEKAINDVLADRALGATSHHISYINPRAHPNGSNYLFVDGHVAQYTLQETLQPQNYMWGKRAYSCSDKPLIRDNP